MDIESLCLKFINTFKLKERQIFRRDNKLYLVRNYIYRKSLNFLPSIYLHCFHSSDEDPELHNHPWTWSLSIILSGSYREEYRVGNDVFARVLGPGNFNFIKANKFHRVDLLSKRVWTIFVSGPKVQDWGFWNRDTLEFTQWEEHGRRMREKPVRNGNVFHFPLGHRITMGDE